eukprot:CAMPEP_0197876776 /NCGR_PEP_ID=MMETSP1439-20131203/5680_1 /TAXON_ID=66791 /ORGANISM="Gonyaulax spinifera, Strain CCMP409" /LENGTH=76 /DNA_ID=CAMNT_0043496081 /DNA_START=94 /DNA_END=324 /DNA_ORIENTATION=+
MSSSSSAASSSRRAAVLFWHVKSRWIREEALPRRPRLCRKDSGVPYASRSTSGKLASSKGTEPLMDVSWLGQRTRR